MRSLATPYSPCLPDAKPRELNDQVQKQAMHDAHAMGPLDEYGFEGRVRSGQSKPMNIRKNVWRGDITYFGMGN